MAVIVRIVYHLYNILILGISTWIMTTCTKRGRERKIEATNVGRVKLKSTNVTS